MKPPGGNIIGMPFGRVGKLKPKAGIAGGTPGTLVMPLLLVPGFSLLLSFRSRLSLSSCLRFDPWLAPREDCGPRLPPVSVAIRRLIAVEKRNESEKVFRRARNGKQG